MFNSVPMSSDAKDNILIAAKALFGEKGFDGTSIRDISKRAKVNVAMVAYYFGCKETLYVDCLSSFSIESAKDFKAILTPPCDKQDFASKLTKLLEQMIGLMEKDAPILKILMREMDSDKKKMNRELVDMTSAIFFTIRDFFQAAINARIIAGDKSADILTVIFMGAISKPVHSEYAIKRLVGSTMHAPDFQKKYTSHLLEVFLNGVVK